MSEGAWDPRDSSSTQQVRWGRTPLALLALSGLLACGEGVEAGEPAPAVEPLLTPAGLARIDPDSIDSLSTEELLEHVTVDGVQRYFDATGGYEVHWEATGALGRRPHELDRLLEVFEAPEDDFQRERVTLALCKIGSVLESRGPREARLLRAFEAALEPEPQPGSCLDAVQYKALRFRAERGDRGALRVLNDCYGGWPGSSYEAAEVVALFGGFRYEPAIPNLVGSLGAMSLNLGGAACDALELLLPGPHPELSGPGVAIPYFERLVAEWEHEQERAREAR